MNLTKKQKTFLDLLSQGKNIFLTGEAGTGKSTIIQVAIKQLIKDGKKVAAIAPTGVAANNIGGQTMHSLFSIPPYGVLTFKECNFVKSQKRKVYDKIDILIIDEVSMLRPDHLDAIHWTLIKNGCDGLDKKQIIFVGDMCQLPPVLNDNTRSVLMRTYDGDRMFFSKIYPHLNVETINLDEVVRQSDTEFIGALNLIRNNKRASYFHKFITNNIGDGIILAPHNATVERYNREGLDKIKGETFTFEATIDGNLNPADYNLEKTVTVKNGAKIMYLINSKDAPLHNGTLGMFVSYNGCHYIRVNDIDYALSDAKLTKKEYVLNDKGTDLELKEIGSITQLPIRLAYALTIHKSQGLTFDDITIDISKPCFQKEQFYVAVSRVRSPNGLKIIT